MKKYLLLIVYVATFSVRGLRSEERQWYSYLARKVPASDCHAQAKALAERFTKITGLLAQGSCDEIHSDGNDLLIRYQAPNPLNLISSVPDLDFPGRGHEFSSEIECLTQIEQEKSIFLSEIGAEPLFAFCRAKENYYGLRRWALVIEGFSDTKNKLAWSSSLVPGRLTATQVEQLRIAVREKLNRNGVNVRFVFLQEDEKGQLRMNILYYGRYPEQLKGFSLAYLDSMEHCTGALQDFRRVETAHPEIVSVVSCIDNPYRHGADLFVAGNVLGWFRIRQSAEHFANYYECQTEKNRLLNLYQTQVSGAILEGFCTEWGPSWKINFIEMPTTP